MTSNSPLREWINILGAVASIAGFVSLALSQTIDDPTLFNAYVGVGISLLSVAVILVAAYRHRRRFVGIIAIAIAIAVGWGGAVWIQHIQDGLKDPVTITAPADGSTFPGFEPSRSITFDIRYDVNHVGADVCDGHLWLIDAQPSGKELGPNRLQELFLAREELPCRTGTGLVRFTASSQWLYHEFFVIRISDADQDWAIRNWTAAKANDHSRDGEWTVMPPSHRYVSGIVRVDRAPA